MPAATSSTTSEPSLHTATVVLSGWREGARKITAAGLLQAECGLSLAEAHRTVDRELDGEAVTVAPNGHRAGLIADLLERGFIAHAP